MHLNGNNFKRIKKVVWSENGPKLQIRDTFTADSKMKWLEMK